jgi:hypothetical protein
LDWGRSIEQNASRYNVTAAFESQRIPFNEHDASMLVNNGTLSKDTVTPTGGAGANSIETVMAIALQSFMLSREEIVNHADHLVAMVSSHASRYKRA